MGIDTYTIGGGTMKVNANLGSNNDNFSFKSYPHTMAGSLDLTVEGGANNDQFNFFLNDVNVPAGSTLAVRASGDTLDQFPNPKDNVADHGQDRIWSGFSGEVDGTLTLQYYGDDTIIRGLDLACSTPACILYCFCSEPVCNPIRQPGDPALCNAPTGLEASLAQVPNYATDFVQSRVILRKGSSGKVTALVDGGLGGDGVALVMQNDNAVGALQSYSATLSGGQPHNFKNDGCYASSTTQGSSSFVAVLGCNEVNPSLGQF